MYDITKQQRKILDYIQQEVITKGYPPSVREICSAVGLRSTSSVHAHLEKLEKKGYIRRDPTKPRAIEILTQDSNILNHKEIVLVPIIGKVAAGQPILAVENIEDTFPVPLDFLDNGDYFMLRIAGNSMINAGILDGDYVLVRQQQTANNGNIVVALIEDEATVKRFYKEENNQFRLQPENSSMTPIFSKNIDILGLVKGVFRKI